MTEPAAQNPAPGFDWGITVAASPTATQPAGQGQCLGEGKCIDQGCPAHYATAPQPAAQQSAPDVTALVEALGTIQKVATHKSSIRTGTHAAIALGCISAICNSALTAHSEQGGES